MAIICVISILIALFNLIMHMKRCFIVLLFGCMPVWMFAAGKIVITGNAPYLRNTEIQLTQMADYITETEMVVASALVRDDGSFRFEFELDETRQLMMRLGTNIHLVYAVPGQTYHLEIPDEAGEELYYPDNQDSTALFYLVSRLNYDFNYFNINNYDKFIAGTVKADAAKFIQDINQRYEWVKDPFFMTLKNYKIAELQYTTRLKGPQQIFDLYFNDKPVQYLHPEYMYMFNMYYEGLILQMTGSNRRRQLKDALENGGPYDSLLVYVQQHEWVKGKELAELFIMRATYDLYYKAGYKKEQIEKILDGARSSTTSINIQTIITDFEAVLNRLKPGTAYIPFEGKKPDGTLVASSELLTKPLYIIFFHPDDPKSLEELPALNNVYDAYKREINFVGICTSCTYSSLQDFISRNKLKFTCLLADPSVETAYEVIFHPYAFLVDTDGTFRFSPAALPSEGAGKQVYTLTRKGRKNDN